MSVHFTNSLEKELITLKTTVYLNLKIVVHFNLKTLLYIV